MYKQIYKINKRCHQRSNSQIH